LDVIANVIVRSARQLHMYCKLGVSFTFLS